MRRTLVGEHLVQLTRWPLIFPVNVYLVREDDGFTLIDASVGGSAPAILAAARLLGAPIVRIALTHAHGDHVGSLDALHAALPEAEVLASARAAALLAGDHSQSPEEAARGRLRGTLKPLATRPTRLLGPGDRVGSLEVVASPGHSPDHIAYFDTRDGTLIAGDAFQVRGGVAVSGTIKPLFPFPALATWHKPTALESARRLRALAPTRLAVGHGRVLEDPLAAMDRAIAEAERALGARAAVAE